MKEKSKFDLYVEQLLHEMPQAVHGELGFIENDKEHEIHLDYIKQNWDFAEKVVIRSIPLNIWKSDAFEPFEEIVFIDEHDQILA